MTNNTTRPAALNFSSPDLEPNVMKNSPKIRAAVCAVALIGTTLWSSTSSASRIVVPRPSTQSLQIVDDRLQAPTFSVPEVGNVDGLSSDGKNTVVATSHSDKGARKSSLSYVSVSDRRVLWTIPLPERSGHTAVSPDGKFAAITQPDMRQVILVDLRTRRIARKVTFDSSPVSVLFSANSKFLYATDSEGSGLHVLSADSAKDDKLVTDAEVNGHLALNPSANRLYADARRLGTVLEIKTPEITVIRSIELGGEIHGLAVSPDGNVLYAANFGDNRLIAYGLASGKLLSVDLVPAPYHVAVVHDTAQVLVMSADNGLLWSLFSKTLKILGQYDLGEVITEVAETDADKQ